MVADVDGVAGVVLPDAVAVPAADAELLLAAIANSWLDDADEVSEVHSLLMDSFKRKSIQTQQWNRCCVQY